MTPERLTLLPDPQFVALRPQLAQRLERAAQAITPANFGHFCDGAMQRVLRTALLQAQASEGSLWLLDPAKEHLVIVFNTGPDSAQVMGFQQPLKAGLVSMVVATQQPFMENEVFKNTQQDKTLDRKLGKRTEAMIVVPLFFANDCRGVLSAVRLAQGAEQAGASAAFTAEHLVQMQFAAELLERLIDLKLLSITTGWGKD